MSVDGNFIPSAFAGLPFTPIFTVNGVDLIKWDAAGQIVEFKVMLRPLKAINLIHERMAAVLQSRQ